jgi:hypothetical protein
LETFLQFAGAKKTFWKPSCNLQEQKKHFGNLPAICRSKKNILETFLQFAGAKKNVLDTIIIFLYIINIINQSLKR